jgi:hypothetical protein
MALIFLNHVAEKSGIRLVFPDCFLVPPLQPSLLGDAMIESCYSEFLYKLK